METVGFFNGVLGDVFKTVRQRIGIKADIDLEKMRLIADKKETRIKELKEAHNILFDLSKEFSQDTTYIFFSSKMSRDQYNNRYLDKWTDLNRFMAIIATYFPQLNDLAEKLAGKINIYWGQQQNLLYQKEKGSDQVVCMEVLNNVTQATFNIEETINSLKVGLNKILNELKED